MEGDVLIGNAIELVGRDTLTRVQRAVLHTVAPLHLADPRLEVRADDLGIGTAAHRLG